MTKEGHYMFFTIGAIILLLAIAIKLILAIRKAFKHRKEFEELFH